MEVSTQQNSTVTGFGYFGSYESRPSFSNDYSSTGCFTGKYDYAGKDDEMAFGYDDDCRSYSTMKSSLSSGCDADSEQDSHNSSWDEDEPMEEESLNSSERCDAYELAASTEMLRIRFPFQSITIRLSDFCCLQEQELLNDTIVDFYLNHVVEHVLPDDASKRVTVLPSLFWHNLSILNAAHNDSEGMTHRQSLDARFGDVLEFVEGFDLLDVDYIVVPVNEWEHWSLAVVCNPFTTAGRVVCFDSQLTDDHNNLQNIATLIDNFLKYAWLRWRGVEYTESLPCVIPANLAQQSNNFDCGVFILEFAHRFLHAPPKDLDDFDFATEYSDFTISRKDMQHAVLSLCSNRKFWNPLVQWLNDRN